MIICGFCTQGLKLLVTIQLHAINTTKANYQRFNGPFNGHARLTHLLFSKQMTKRIPHAITIGIFDV